MEDQSFDRASENKNASLMRPFPPESGHRDPDLPERIFRRDQAEDREDPDFPEALLRVRFLALVFGAQLAFDLDACALRERFGEL